MKARSYAVLVRTGSDEWSGNALRFYTRAHAEEYARNLAARWTSVTEWKVVESDDPPGMSEEEK